MHQKHFSDIVTRPHARWLFRIKYYVAGRCDEDNDDESCCTVCHYIGYKISSNDKSVQLKILN